MSTTSSRSTAASAALRHGLCRRLLSVGQQLEIHGAPRRAILRRRAASEPGAVSALHPADPEAGPRPHGRRRQPPVRRHGANRVDAEAVLSTDASNAALCDQELIYIVIPGLVPAFAEASADTNTE